MLQVIVCSNEHFLKICSLGALHIKRAYQVSQYMEVKHGRHMRNRIGNLYNSLDCDDLFPMFITKQTCFRSFSIFKGCTVFVVLSM